MKKRIFLLLWTLILAGCATNGKENGPRTAVKENLQKEGNILEYRGIRLDLPSRWRYGLFSEYQEEQGLFHFTDAATDIRVAVVFEPGFSYLTLEEYAHLLPFRFSSGQVYHQFKEKSLPGSERGIAQFESEGSQENLEAFLIQNDQGIYSFWITAPSLTEKERLDILDFLSQSVVLKESVKTIRQIPGFLIAKADPRSPWQWAGDIADGTSFLLKDRELLILAFLYPRENPDRIPENTDFQNITFRINNRLINRECHFYQKEGIQEVMLETNELTALFRVISYPVDMKNPQEILLTRYLDSLLNETLRITGVTE